jgi:hypothetical protein
MRDHYDERRLVVRGGPRDETNRERVAPEQCPADRWPAGPEREGPCTANDAARKARELVEERIAKGRASLPLVVARLVFELGDGIVEPGRRRTGVRPSTAWLEARRERLLGRGAWSDPTWPSPDVDRSRLPRPWPTPRVTDPQSPELRSRWQALARARVTVGAVPIRSHPRGREGPSLGLLLRRPLRESWGKYTSALGTFSPSMANLLRRPQIWNCRAPARQAEPPAHRRRSAAPHASAKPSPHAFSRSAATVGSSALAACRTRARLWQLGASLPLQPAS